MKFKIDDGIVFNIKNCHLSFNDFEYDTHDIIRDSFLEERKENFNSDNKTIHTISLNPTYKCDGSCSYCYNINDINKNDKILTFDDFERSIENLKLNNYQIELNSLRVYGGEPLLVEQLSDLIIKIKEKYNFDTLYISSGLLFDDTKFDNAIKQLQKIIDANIEFTIGVSVDFGLTEKQFTRISNKTTITRQILLDRCSVLEDIGVKVVYATIISKNTSIDLLKKHIIEHFNNKYDKFDGRDMDSNANRYYAYRISVSNHNMLYPDTDKIYQLYDMYNELYDILPITSNLYPYTDVIYSPDIIQLDTDNYLFIFPDTYCGIYSDMIAIFPNGEVGSCHMTPYDRNLKPSVEHSEYFFNNDKCNKCDFYGICRGLCVNRNIQAEKAMDSYCLWAQLSFNLSLKRLYALQGNNSESFKEFLNNNKIE